MQSATMGMNHKNVLSPATTAVEGREDARLSKQKKIRNSTPNSNKLSTPSRRASGTAIDSDTRKKLLKATKNLNSSMGTASNGKVHSAIEELEKKLQIKQLNVKTPISAPTLKLKRSVDSDTRKKLRKATSCLTKSMGNNSVEKKAPKEESTPKRLVKPIAVSSVGRRGSTVDAAAARKQLMQATRRLNKSMGTFGETTTATEESIAKQLNELDPETRANVHKLHDPNLPLKEKVRLELELKKQDHVASLIGDMQYLDESRSFLQKKQRKVAKKERRKSKNLEEEARRQKREEENRKRLQQQKQEEKIRKQKEDEALDQELQKHVAKESAANIEKIRIGMEKAKVSTTKRAEIEKRKTAEHEKLIDVRRAYIQEQLVTVDNDVMRHLKEAVLEQNLETDNWLQV